MLYDFQLGHNVTEESLSTWSAKYSWSQHSTRWFKKFHSDWKNCYDQSRSDKSQTVNCEFVRQVVLANSSISTLKEQGVLESGVLDSLQDLGRCIQNYASRIDPSSSTAGSGSLQERFGKLRLIKRISTSDANNRNVYKLRLNNTKLLGTVSKQGCFEHKRLFYT